MQRTFTPEEAQAIRDAYLLARRTLRRKLTAAESHALAKIILEVARPGHIVPEVMAMRAVARAL